MALDNELSAEEQAQFDAMRDADAQPGLAETPAAAEAPSAPAEAEPEKPQQTKMVPHAALHEEREMRKAAERRAEEDRQRFEDRFNQLLQRIPAPQPTATPEAPAIPDMREDPVGHIVETLKQQGASQQQIAQAQTQIVQAIQAGTVEQQLRGWAMARETEFKALAPDYEKAVDHLRTVRDAQLQAMGMIDAFARKQQIDREALEIAANAYRGQRNPAEVLFAMAKASGYAAAAVPEPAAETAAADKLKSVAAGQEQARGLPRGSAPPAMNAAKLLEMSDAEFAKALESPDNLALMGS